MEKQHFLLCILSAVFCFPQTTHAQVNFFKGTFEEAKSEAEAKDKLIFLDCYTTWCLPCKKLDKEVFPDLEVASLLNNSFINYKIDCEGSNRAIAEFYRVSSYPNLIILRPDGIELGRVPGFVSAKNLITMIRSIISRTPQGSLLVSYRVFWDKTHSYEFASKYFPVRQSFGLWNDDLVGELIAALPPDSLEMEDVEKLIVKNVNRLSGIGFEYLLERKNRSKRCAAKINALIQIHARQICILNDKQQLVHLEKIVARVYQDEPHILAIIQSDIQHLFYLTNGSNKKFMQSAEIFVNDTLLPALKNSIESNDNVLCEVYLKTLDNIIWQCNEYIDNKKYMEKAINWAAISAELQKPTKERCQTALALCEKAGNKKMRAHFESLMSQSNDNE